MDVTSDVSHVEMWPYVASADALSESHAETAVLMVLSSMTELRRRTGLGSAHGAAAKRAITIHMPFILLGAANGAAGDASRTSKSLISEFGFVLKTRPRGNFRCKTSKTTCLVLPDAKGSHSGAMRPR